MPEAAIVPVPESRLDDLKELFRELYVHHTSLAPHLHEREVPFEEAWRARRALEARWLRDEPDSFVLAARDGDRYVAYAFVRVRSGEGVAVTWHTSHPLAELVTLVVLPELRGSGTGTALLEAVEEQLRSLGVEDMLIAVVTTNTAAMRLYERRGAVPFVTNLVQSVESRGEPQTASGSG